MHACVYVCNKGHRTKGRMDLKGLLESNIKSIRGFYGQQQHAMKKRQSRPSDCIEYVALHKVTAYIINSFIAPSLRLRVSYAARRKDARAPVLALVVVDHCQLPTANNQTTASSAIQGFRSNCVINDTSTRGQRCIDATDAPAGPLLGASSALLSSPLLSSPCS